MRPLVLSTPAYTVAFVIAMLIWAVPERIGSFWWRSARDPTARKQDRGSVYVVVGSLLVGVVVAYALASGWTGAAIPWLRPQVTIVGIALIVLGAMLRWWAILTLGRYFTIDVAVRSAQAVVQSGPYRFVRHPAYSGMLLTLLGIGLALANWASVVAVLTISLIGMLYRVRVEERALIAALGQPYVDYMRRTKRFIPFMF
ncbi:MAG TPA: isoprenylcysteine carboxylmethyltransferase family protein [Ktedonobacterales bacterium]|nr:isoprenylcysteine carboxylmethyltransferase family protein [Ktedonobacterales bacterium]